MLVFLVICYKKAVSAKRRVFLRLAVHNALHDKTF